MIVYDLRALVIFSVVGAMGASFEAKRESTRAIRTESSRQRLVDSPCGGIYHYISKYNLASATDQTVKPSNSLVIGKDL